MPEPTDPGTSSDQPYQPQPPYQPPTPYGQQPPPPPPPSAGPPQGPPTGYQQSYPPPGYYGPPPLPKQPQATMALILGIIGLGSIAFCGVLLVLSPFAWVLGHTAVKEIDANPGVYGGRGEAQAGRIMGIIGTVLLILVVIVAALLITTAIVSPEFFDEV